MKWMRRLRADESGKLLADLRAYRKAHRWHPHRLRHAHGTKVRRLYGAEASRLALGHKSIDVTLLYAEPSRARCQEIARAIG